LSLSDARELPKCEQCQQHYDDDDPQREIAKMVFGRGRFRVSPFGRTFPRPVVAGPRFDKYCNQEDRYPELGNILCGGISAGQPNLDGPSDKNSDCYTEQSRYEPLDHALPIHDVHPFIEQGQGACAGGFTVFTLDASAGELVHGR
jgi:hypothetical protein